MKSSSLLTRGLASLFGLIVFILLWQLASGYYHQVILPSPMEVARSVVKLTVSGQLWEQGGQTIARGLAGFGLAVLIGLPLGLFIGLSPLISSLLRPMRARFTMPQAIEKPSMPSRTFEKNGIGPLLRRLIVSSGI